VGEALRCRRSPFRTANLATTGSPSSNRLSRRSAGPASPTRRDGEYLPEVPEIAGGFEKAVELPRATTAIVELLPRTTQVSLNLLAAAGISLAIIGGGAVPAANAHPTAPPKHLLPLSVDSRTTATRATTSPPTHSLSARRPRHRRHELHQREFVDSGVRQLRGRRDPRRDRRLEPSRVNARRAGIPKTAMTGHLPNVELFNWSAAEVGGSAAEEPRSGGGGHW
jgi:hypothetical protein